MYKYIAVILFLLGINLGLSAESSKEPQFLEKSYITSSGLTVERFTDKTLKDRVLNDLKPLYFKYYQRDLFKPDMFESRWNRISANNNYCMLVAYEKGEGEKISPIMFIDGTVFDSLYHNVYMRLDSVYIANDKNDPSWEAKEMAIFKQVYPLIEEFAKAKGATVISTNCGDVYTQERRLFGSVLKQADPTDSAYFQKKLQ